VRVNVHTLHCRQHIGVTILLLLRLDSEDSGYSINNKIPTNIGAMLVHHSTFSLDNYKLVHDELWFVWVIEVLLVAKQTVRKKVSYLLEALGFWFFAITVGSCQMSVRCTFNGMFECLQ
jgi:hypothetical protein